MVVNDEWDAYIEDQWRKIAAGLTRALDRAINPPVPADPNPFPRFRLFRWLP